MAKNNGIESENPWRSAISLREGLAKDGKRVVMTNGCFDLLHLGHVRLLEVARSLGDALIVAINSDASVRALKGSDRPINGEQDRAGILRALRCVDAVVVFDERRATSAIHALKPDVYVKGGDYDLSSLDPVEKAALEAMGTKISFVPLLENRSTTSSLKRVERRGRKLRLGFLGSGRGGTLRSLIETIDKGELDAEIALVVSDVADSGVLSIARTHGLQTFWIDPGNRPTRFSDEAQGELANRLKMLRIDLVILGGFMRRLRSPLIDAFPQRILNLHPSLLPRFPGRAAWEQAIEAGVAQTGSTVHLVDEGLDTGRILGQVPVTIGEGDTPEALLMRIQQAEHELYPRVIREYGTQLLMRNEPLD